MVQIIIDGARVPGTDGLNQLDRDFTTCIYGLRKLNIARDTFLKNIQRNPVF